MQKQHFFYRIDRVLKKMEINHIIFLEVTDNYTRFHTSEGKHIIRISLDTALGLLPKDRFAKVHRSYAVAIDHVDVLGRDFVTLVPFPDIELPVSRVYYTAFVKKVVVLESLTTGSAKQEQE